MSIVHKLQPRTSGRCVFLTMLMSKLTIFPFNATKPKGEVVWTRYEIKLINEKVFDDLLIGHGLSRHGDALKNDFLWLFCFMLFLVQ